MPFEQIRYKYHQIIYVLCNREGKTGGNLFYQCPRCADLYLTFSKMDKFSTQSHIRSYLLIRAMTFWKKRGKNEKA